MVKVNFDPVPPTTKGRFTEIAQELIALHEKKAKDYDGKHIPYKNVRCSADWGIKPWVGAMIRANDKMRRLQTFVEKGELANESVVDSFNDLANYAIIARILYEEENAGSNQSQQQAGG